MSPDRHPPPVRTVIRLLELPTRTQLATAHDPNPESTRLLTVVELESPGGPAGWGECAALNRPGYSSEHAEGAFAALAAGEPDPVEMPLAAAALEMARLDADLKGARHSLAQHLGSTRNVVPAGVVLGLDPVPSLLTAAADLLDAGYERLKIKVTPADGVARVRAIRAELGSEFELHADANGSFAPDQASLLHQMIADGLDAIEQPFGPGETHAMRDLVSRADVPVLVDEGAPTAHDVRSLQADGALSGLVVKPSRFGGIAPATALLAWCATVDLPCAIGGMLESGLGRHALAAVASLPAFEIVGDLSPAGRWLAADPWPDLERRGGSIVVPSTPGVAPEPDRLDLDRYTIKRFER